MQDNLPPLDPIDLRKGQIQLEKLKTFYRQFPVFMILAPTGASLLVFLQSDVVARTIWLPWLVSVLIVNGFGCGLLFVVHKKIGSQLSHADRLHRILTIFSVITGIVWGAVGVLFFPMESLEHQLLTFVWLWSLAAMISASTVALASMFHILILLILLPLAIRSTLAGDVFHLAMGGTTVVYMLGLVFMYRINHNTFLEAVILRFQNIDLIEQLHREKEVAEQANHAKSQFLSAASHDLRQPVHAQGLFIAELDDYVDNPRGRRVLAGLESSIDTLRRLLDTVLDVAKLDAGVVALHIQDMPIAPLLEEIRAEYAPQFDDQGIQLRIVHTSAKARTDRVLLGQILRNFVSNALRYTLDGCVLIGCRRQADHVRIEVWDTGIGIMANQFNAIFDEFYQIGNPERDRDKGLGLGLAIVRRISHLLGCAVSLRSKLNGGSVFSVEVPAGTYKLPIDTVPPGQVDLTGVSVLLIEDEKQVSDAMQGLLTRWGCQVLNVTCVDEALEKLVLWPHRPDVILTDYRLRGKETGAMAIQRIRAALVSNVPAIVVTGDTSPARIQEAFSSGDPVLHKPVPPGLLRTSIAQACGRERSI